MWCRPCPHACGPYLSRVSDLSSKLRFSPIGLETSRQDVCLKVFQWFGGGVWSCETDEPFSCTLTLNEPVVL